MSMSQTRPLRTLAAWGYESASSGTRVEVDVWTVNEGTQDGEDEDDAQDRAERAFADDGRVTVLDAVGNIAKVSYGGAAGVGYREIDTGEKTSQNAWAGSIRAAGGDRTGGGTFEDGWSPPPNAPGIDEVVTYGEREVLPTVRREMMELGQSIRREESRDEVDEPITDESPFRGFKHVVRVFPHGGRNAWRYEVKGRRMVRLSKGDSPTVDDGRTET